MSKTLDWSKTYKSPVGDIRRGHNNKNKFGSVREAVQAQAHQIQEREKAMENLNKAMPVLENILLQRMVGHNPIKIVRPLQFTTEILDNGMESQEEDDGFYAIKKSEKFDAKFKSTVRTLRPGTELTFTHLEKSMNQMWFKTQTGEEIGIYVEEKKNLLVQSDIYDLVMAYKAE